MVQATTHRHDESPPWLSARLYPFASHFREIAGCRVHYVDEGDGPTVLLLHGNPTWSFLYRDIILGLRGRCRCIALDLPGYGLSAARVGYGYTIPEHVAVVEQFVLTLDLTEVTLMGQDWGGPIGLAVASRHAHRFRRLVLGNTFAWPLNGTPRLVLFSRLMGGPIGGLMIRRFNALINVGLPVGCRQRQLVPAIMEAYRGPFTDPAAREPMRIAAGQLLAAQPFLARTEAGLADLRHVPALLVWGNRDPAFRAAERHRFERYFPHHQTIILNGAGHFIQEDAGPALAEAITRFVTG